MKTPTSTSSLSWATTGKWLRHSSDRTPGIKRGANGSAQPGQPGSPMGAPF